MKTSWYHREEMPANMPGRSEALVTCHATTKGSKRAGTPRQCKAPAIAGGRVCVMHGGLAPQVRRKALERIERLIDPERVLRQSAAIAYADLGQFYGPDGQLLPMAQWPAGWGQIVQQVETIARDTTPGERGPASSVHRIRLWDKPKQIELLFKHLGLLVEKTEVKGELTFKWMDSEAPPTIEAETVKITGPSE